MVPHNKTDKLGLMAEKAFREAVKKALAQHRKMGVPAVFTQNGKIVYLMPNGKIVTNPGRSKSPRKSSAR